ncbi:hypothetical protein [Salimicrobium flavidum]|uniref:Uncharacterized protein n=1 Tax=Salimicrobium flavidum TaxID=570947 RepID=A0A1N7JXN0_9BACI|nr:hypothetical protein [Salimicrobium flavidum]SIS54088.1 hypothetical protein SAMN05421687_10830 [Salimicrobium flavidum]
MTKTKRDTFAIFTEHFGYDVERIAKQGRVFQFMHGVNLAQDINGRMRFTKPLDLEETAEDFIFYVNNEI